jgi:hypothetical protein
MGENGHKAMWMGQMSAIDLTITVKKFI